MALTIVTREQWGAADPTGPIHTVEIGDRTAFFVHYLGSEKSNPKDPAAQVRGVQKFHQGPQRRWSDVGYSYLVAQDGTVFEGRGRDAVGAHCPGWNRKAVSVCALIGEGEIPSAEMKAAIVALHAETEKAAGKDLPVKGHRDGKKTACPGAELYAWLKAGMPLAAPEAPKPAAKPAPKPAAAKKCDCVKVEYPGQVLRVGSKGLSVEKLQAQLNKQGFPCGPADGIFGIRTQRSVEAFQAARKLVRDSLVGPTTWRKLFECGCC